MATTATWALPYPLSSGTVNVSGDIQSLATAVDTALTTVKNPPAGILLRSAALSIPNTAFTDITWPTEDFDNASLSVAGGSTFTVPAGFGGFWQVSCVVQWAANGTGTRSVTLQVNGTGVVGAYAESIPTAAAVTRHGFSRGIKLAAGDALKVQAFQSSGGALNLSEGAFTIVRLSA